MVTLKTKSQLKSFIKRQHPYNIIEGCGCCWQAFSIDYDSVTKRVIEVHTQSIAGKITACANVLAIYKSG